MRSIYRMQLFRPRPRVIEAKQPEETIETPIGPGPAGMNLNNIKVCARCGLRYDWRKSPSTTLKMTYCGSLCERADLGFTLEALLKSGPKPEPRETATPVV
jgi:hypothetical protein